jgi:circadian clock protein KaiB
MTDAPALSSLKAAAEGPEPPCQIRLYIAGSTPNSLRAQRSLRDATDAMQDAAERLDIQVIDVFKGPKRAIADGILVTPTLIAQYGGKRVMIVGDLSDSAALRSVLDACVSPAVTATGTFDA